MRLIVDGKDYSFAGDVRMSPRDPLRKELGLFGTKNGRDVA